MCMRAWLLVWAYNSVVSPDKTLTMHMMCCMAWEGTRDAHDVGSNAFLSCTFAQIKHVRVRQLKKRGHKCFQISSPGYPLSHGLVCDFEDDWFVILRMIGL